MQFIDPNQDRWSTLDIDIDSDIDSDGAGQGDVVAAAPLVPREHLLLEPAQWQAVRASWPAGLMAGLLLPNDAAVADIAADLPRFGLVVLRFPKWTDGRAYSQARLLRSRHRYSGELRATGEVLVDMLPLLQRNGIDAVVLRGDQSLDAARRALGFFDDHYQGDTHESRPRFARTAA